MKKPIVLRLILIAAIVIFLAGGTWLILFSRQRGAEAQNLQQQLIQLEKQAAALDLRLEGLTTANADAQTAQAEQLSEEAQTLRTGLDTLRGEIQNLQTYITENQESIDLAKEELAYLQGVYDELEEGLEKVNGYLAEG